MVKTPISLYRANRAEPVPAVPLCRTLMCALQTMPDMRHVIPYLVIKDQNPWR